MHSLSALSTAKNLTIYLTRLVAHRPIYQGTPDIIKIRIRDSIEAILSEGYSDYAAFMGISDLINNDQNGRFFPTIEKLKTEIEKYDFQVRMILDAHENHGKELAPGVEYRMDGNLAQVIAAISMPISYD